MNQSIPTSIAPCFEGVSEFVFVAWCDNEVCMLVWLTGKTTALGPKLERFGMSCKGKDADGIDDVKVLLEELLCNFESEFCFVVDRNVNDEDKGFFGREKPSGDSEVISCSRLLREKPSTSYYFIILI